MSNLHLIYLKFTTERLHKRFNNMNSYRQQARTEKQLPIQRQKGTQITKKNKNDTAQREAGSTSKQGTQKN